MTTKTLILFTSILFALSVTSQSLYFPPTTGSVWDSILPSSLNYCQPRIDSLYNYLQAKNTKSFIIIKDGKRVVEKYFGTYTKDSIWYWASASKSLTSFITGVTQQKGYLNINNSVSQYIGSGWSNATIAKENLISVKHLLSMTSGLDDTPTSGCTNEDTSKICLQYLTDAGLRWAYHTGAYKKLQDVVSNTVGQTYNAITNNFIENKTGMSGVWLQQVYYSKARDMARFGLLNLNKGIWANDTILKDSLYFKAMINTSQTYNNAYGYLWWLNGKSNFMTPGFPTSFTGVLMPNAPSDMFCALGKNDQKIYVIPSKNMVIVRQGNTAGGFNLAASAFDNILWDYINKLDCSITYVNEIKKNISAKIYPNPASNALIIEFEGEIKKIIVYDLFGKEVFVNPTINSDFRTIVAINELNLGIYILQLTDALGNKQQMKFIKN